MQGDFELILRGKKKDIARARVELGIAALPEYPVQTIRDLTSSGESFPSDYSAAADDDVVRYSFKSTASGNISGQEKWAEEIAKAFPELELLLYLEYADYVESGSAVYSAPDSPKCTMLSWEHYEYNEDPGDMDEDEIERKLQMYRDYGLECGLDVDDMIYILSGYDWHRDSGPKVSGETLNELLGKEGFDSKTASQWEEEWRRREEEWRRREEECRRWEEEHPNWREEWLRQEEEKRRQEEEIRKKICQEVDVAVSGSAFVLSGVFAHFFGDKNKIKALIVSKGGRCTEAVSGKTNYLVLGSEGEFGMKTIERAQEFQKKGKDIKIIREDTLFKFL